MNIKRLLLIGLLFSTGLLNAQRDFRPGYIIKNSGDTVYGEIDYRGDLLMCRVCRFKAGKRNIVEYWPDEINSFRFIDSKYYISKRINGTAVFLECLIKGKVSIYYLRDSIGDDYYYMDKEQMQLVEIPYKEKVRYEDVGLVMYKSKKHIGLLNVYMQDAPHFQSQIAKIDKPDHENLIDLAKKYHNSVCKGEQCIIYTKKQPLVKAKTELLSGIMTYTNLDDSDNKERYWQGGVAFYFWVPRANEKLYFKTGLYTQAYASEDDDKTYYFPKLQSHIGYLAPKSYRLRPSFSVGLLSPSYTGGMLVRISKRINIGVQTMFNYKPSNFRLVPSELDNYSVLIGIHFEPK